MDQQEQRNQLIAEFVRTQDADVYEQLRNLEIKMYKEQTAERVADRLAREGSSRSRDI